MTLGTLNVQFVEVLGRRVRYLDEGSGHPLLLCHGFIGSLENFHTWGPAFAGHRRVLIPDLPGCGETAAGAAPTTVASHAEFMHAFAERLELLTEVGATRTGHLAEPPLQPPAFGLERERLRVALGERLFEARERRRVCAEKLFDLLQRV